MIRAKDRQREVRFSYKGVNKLASRTENGATLRFSYDTDGNRTRITSSLGADIAAAYNPLGDLLGMTSFNWQTDYQRDLFGLETGRSMAGGVATETERDRLGRVTSQITCHNRRRVTEKEYIWGLNDQLLSITNNGKRTIFEYDGWGNLAKATYPDGKIIHRNPDKAGNLFETVDRIDRKYSTGGRLEQSKDWTYKYDDEGHLTEKRHRVQVQQAWKYRWNDAGMLEDVVRPDGSRVSFKYDALGRRIEKRLFNRKTRWVWDGNVPLHEWNEVYKKDFTEERGEFYNMKPSKTTTWLFEEGTFVPNGKLVGEESFSIQSNYLGTPEVMYNADGKVVWSAELDAYGDVQELTGERTDCPFRFQGQYEDREKGLFYNRFRYYSAEEGMYISQDPTRLCGGNCLYGYVIDPYIGIDPFGLKGKNPTVTKGTKGEPLTATATVSPSDIGKGSTTNETSREHARSQGKKDDDAGHILGNKLGGQGGKANVFPQDSSINRGEYRTFEARVANDIKKNGSANLSWTFHYDNGGTRPTGITYTVERNGQLVMEQKFGNGNC